MPDFPPGVVNCAAYAGGRRVADVPIADISEVVKDPARFLWIGLHEPSEELLREVQAEFGLHDLAVEDAHRAHQRPKLERYGDILFLVLHTAQRQDGRAGFGETHLFYGERFLISVRHGPSASYAEVRGRCEQTPKLLAKGPAFALYAVMDFIVDQFAPILDGLEEGVEEVEEDLLAGRPGAKLTRRIYTLKRELLGVKRAVAPLLDLCNRLERLEADLVPEDVRPYFRDVYDHAIRLNEAADNQRELLGSALEANLSLISIEQNNAMKKLAGWAAIFAVPTMIAGVYGMNFQFMPELGWKLGYPLTMALMLVVCLWLHVRFRRAGWL